MTCDLYRYFDKDERLLYVGISFNAFKRMGGHNEKPWFTQISSMTVERFESRELALAAELRAIRTEKPIHNIAHNDKYQQNEMFKPDECGEELERISVNSIAVNQATEPPVRRWCPHCDGDYDPDCCLAKCYAKLRPFEWFLDLEKTGRTVSIDGKDYAQYRGVNAYGDLVVNNVPVGAKPHKICVGYKGGRALGRVFFTFKAA
jgi:hypothetical protein